MAEGSPGAAVGTTATGTLGSGVGPGGGGVVGAVVGAGGWVGAAVAGGALAVSSATTVWAAWVWRAATSWVGAGVAGWQAPNTKAAAISKLNNAANFLFGCFFFITTWSFF